MDSLFLRTSVLLLLIYFAVFRKHILQLLHRLEKKRQQHRRRHNNLSHGTKVLNVLPCGHAAPLNGLMLVHCCNLESTSHHPFGESLCFFLPFVGIPAFLNSELLCWISYNLVKYILSLRRGTWEENFFGDFSVFILPHI